METGVIQGNAQAKKTELRSGLTGQGGALEGTQVEAAV